MVIKAYSGITLVELAIVLLIAVLIIGTITPVYFHIIESKRTDLAIAEITRMQKYIDRFGRKNSRLPADLTELTGSAPMDPWGNPYRYINIRDNTSAAINPRTTDNLKRLNADYDLYSDGPDKSSLSPIGANESRDDIIRARNGNYIGIARDLR